MDRMHFPSGQDDANEAFGLRRVIRVRPEHTGGAFAIFEENVPEGAGPPLHVHQREHETFTVIEGRIRFRAAEEEFVAEAGDIVLIPPGTPHTFQGKGPGIARALVQLSPGAAAGFFEAVTAEGLSPPADMARIEEIAAAHNIAFVGPPLD